jgi:FimV-like protein
MIRLRHLLFAAIVASLAVSGNAASVVGGVGMKLGDSEFIYRQTVKKDNLWTISLGLMPTTGNVTQNQVMAAILHRNPNAFDQGSMFYLRRGIVLTVPSLEAIRAEDIAKSDALFSNQHQAWSEGRVLLPDQHAVTEKATGTYIGGHEAGAKGEPSVSSTAPSIKSEISTVTSAPKNQPVSSSDGAADPKLKAQLGKSNESKDALSQVEAQKSQSSSQGSNLPYILALAVILAGLFFYFFRHRESQSATNTSDALSASIVHPLPEVGRTKAGRTKAPDGIVVTQQVVANDSLDSATSERPRTGDEAGLKLDIAKAYLELNRNDDARVLLEEVTVEGGAGTRNKAKKLLGR